jgi:hypothetical protein
MTNAAPKPGAAFFVEFKNETPCFVFGRNNPNAPGPGRWGYFEKSRGIKVTSNSIPP